MYIEILKWGGEKKTSVQSFFGNPAGENFYTESYTI